MLRAFAGLPPLRRETRAARAAGAGRSPNTAAPPTRWSRSPNAPDGGLAAYPMGKGSGAVTAFSLADGFFAIARRGRSRSPPAVEVAVTLIGGERSSRADLIVIGSHCVGLDYLIGRLARQGLSAKVLSVGSTARARGGQTRRMRHRRHAPDGPGDRRLQPPVPRRHAASRAAATRACRASSAAPTTPASPGTTPPTAIAAAAADPQCLMVNRNAGSGTRILIDRLLGGARPAGYIHQASSHNAVAAAVAQGRADWGVAIETVAERYGLGFLPLAGRAIRLRHPRRAASTAPRCSSSSPPSTTRRSARALAGLGFPP